MCQSPPPAPCRSRPTLIRPLVFCLHPLPLPPLSSGVAGACTHLCSLVLKPDLDHTHAEACLCRQRLSDLPIEKETGQAWG